MAEFDKVDYLARLIRIKLSDEEKDLFSKQLGDILDYVKQLQEVDVTGVSPMYHPLMVTNRFREDKVKDSLRIEEVLKNAPESRGNFFVVPKVIENA